MLIFFLLLDFVTKFIEEMIFLVPQIVAALGQDHYMKVTFCNSPALFQIAHSATCTQALTLTFGGDTRLHRYSLQNVTTPTYVLIGGSSGEVTSWTNQQIATTVSQPC